MYNYLCLINVQALTVEHRKGAQRGDLHTTNSSTQYLKPAVERFHCIHLRVIGGVNRERFGLRLR